MASPRVLPRLYLKRLTVQRRPNTDTVRSGGFAAFSTSSVHAAEDPYTAKSAQVPPRARPPPDTNALPSFGPEEVTDGSNPNLHGYISTTSGKLTTSTETHDTTTPDGPTLFKHPSRQPPLQGAASQLVQDLSRPSPRARTRSLPDILSNLQDQGRKKDSFPPSIAQSSGQRRASRAQRTSEREARVRAEQARAENTRSIENLMLQRSAAWSIGDVYSPHDLSPAEHLKTKSARQIIGSKSRRPLNTRRMRQADVVDQLQIQPLLEYKNMTMMGEFVSDMGRIKSARETGLRTVNQRKMAKAVRRAIGIGLLPSVHRHPELFPERLDQRGQIYDRGSSPFGRRR